MLVASAAAGAAAFADPGEPLAPAQASRAGDATMARPNASQLDLDSLMAAFARVRSIRARFVETRELALLDAPIESSGEIVILPPDRLHRRTSNPAPATLVIDGDRLRFEDGLGREEIDLAARPEARQFVDHMLAVTSGDIDALRERYELYYEPRGDEWTLRLEPRSFPMKRLLSAITLKGEGRELREMIVAESDGDETRSVFTETEIDATLSDAELGQLFGSSAAGLGADASEPGR